MKASLKIVPFVVLGLASGVIAEASVIDPAQSNVATNPRQWRADLVHAGPTE